MNPEEILKESIRNYGKWYKQNDADAQHAEKRKNRLIRKVRFVRIITFMFLYLCIYLLILTLWSTLLKLVSAPVSMFEYLFFLFLSFLFYTGFVQYLFPGWLMDESTCLQGWFWKQDHFADGDIVRAYAWKTKPQPTASQIYNSFFDSLGNVKPMYTFTATQKRLELEYKEYFSEDAGGHVVECDIQTENKEPLLLSLYGNEGPTCSKELRQIIRTEEHCEAFAQKTPKDIRKDFYEIQLFPQTVQWKFLAWDIEDADALCAKLNEVTAKIACLVAAEKLNIMCSNKETDEPECFDIEKRTILASLLTEKSLSPYFQKTLHAKECNVNIEDLERYIVRRGDISVI